MFKIITSEAMPPGMILLAPPYQLALARAQMDGIETSEPFDPKQCAVIINVGGDG